MDRINEVLVEYHIGAQALVLISGCCALVETIEAGEIRT